MMKKIYTILIMFAFLGLNAMAQTAYVTNQNGNSVSVINVTTNTVSTTITVGSNPYGVSVSRDGSRVYITNYGDNTVSVITTATNAVSTPITVGNNPYGIAVLPDGSKVYITNNGIGTNTVSVINAANNTVSATVTVGASPIGVAVSPDGSKVYVTNRGANTVNIINTTTDIVSDTIIVGLSPIGIAVSPDGSKVYVANSGGNTVSVISTTTNTVTTTITVGASPYGVSASPVGGKVYVTNSIDNTVSVIAADTISATITVNPIPVGVSVSPDGSKVYVACNHNCIGTGSVNVINTATNTVSTTVPVGNCPRSFGNFITCTVPSPAISGTTSFCQGDSVTLDAGVYSSYLWNNGRTTETIIVTTGNTYTVTVTNNPACTGTASQVITMNPLPPIPTIIQAGNILISSASTGIQWLKNNVILPNDTNYIDTATSTGCYSVMVTNSYGCTAVSDTVCVNFAGINEISNNHGINIYPNPATTILNIHHSSYTSQETLLITDLLGTEVYKEKLTGIDNIISISNWSNGIYFYQIRNDKETLQGKFVVQK